MPQLDPASFASQIFWLFICFTALYVIMNRWVLPRIGGVLQERRNKIETDLERAEQLRQDAEKVLSNHEAALADAHQRAAVILHEAYEADAAQATKQMAALDDHIKKQLAEADARIDEAKQAAIADIQDFSAPLTGEVLKKLAAVKPAAAVVKKAVVAATREIT